MPDTTPAVPTSGNPPNVAENAIIPAAPPHIRLTIVYKPVEWLKPYERNPRKNDAAVQRMVASIREYGFTVPVLARSSGEIVDGHLRWKAATVLALDEVPVILCDGWSEAQVKAFRLLVNRSVAWAQWDMEAVAAELADLKAMDFSLEMTGFDAREIDVLTLSPNAEEDEIPPVPEAPVSIRGDLWLLGPHRIICGDCTDQETVARVLAGGKPRLLCTDPPYGVSLDMEWRDRAGHNSAGPAEKSYMKNAIRLDMAKRKTARERAEGNAEEKFGIAAMAGDESNDKRGDWALAYALVESLEIAYVWHATPHMVAVATGLESIGFQLRQQLIWHKTVAAMSRSAYHWKHEPCWYAVKKGKTATWRGSKDQTTVWDAASPKQIFGGSKEEKLPHPTQKPVELMRRPILNHLKQGEGVYEPFIGSGTTLAAAELTERVCYGCEIEPRYMDVVIARWEKLSGKEATLEATGQTFAHVRDGRRLAAEDAIKEEAIGG